MSLLRRRRQETNAPAAVSFRVCPAKTFTTDDGTVKQGRTVLNHCVIVGTVARELVRRMPEALAEALFPRGFPLAAAAHDIGKVSPTFVEKIRRACSPGCSPLKPLANINPGLESSWGGHAGVSQLTAKALGAPEFIPEILGQHHGFSPALSGLRADDICFGGAEWQAERTKLLNELKIALGEDWPCIASAAQARVLAGLTSVSDWVGSGQFFENPDDPWEGSIANALDKAGFIPPTYRRGLSFSEIFGFEPRPAQTVLVEQVTGPGVYVLEAPMGMGKTEAALFAAYHLLAEGQSGGIYFALPTQLTSNKIHERFRTFLEQVLADDCRHGPLLLHANAWLLDTDMGEEGRPGGAWFNQAKRGLLAPFAVGTIDQALMAAMNVKHGFVRAFGLAGKVVILDEVHTYDAYTGTLLDALVGLLGQLKCTVIILSATLNHDRRQQLVGRELSDTAYPLITASQNGQPVAEIPLEADDQKEVKLRVTADDRATIEQVLLRAEKGQQVIWIENTVLEAQKRYLDLAARASGLNVACGLLHSRFTPDDRKRIEDHWVNCFGKVGWEQRSQQGRILVGTQVLEQSLDIDADFMVSRFAPSDMLLQRLGRLWRHTGTPRETTSVPEAWLLAPDLDTAIQTPEAAFDSTAFVYSPYVLCRSLEVWCDRKVVRLPADIRPVVEATYFSRAEIEPMNRWLAELEHGSRVRVGRKTLQQLAQVGLAEGGNTLPETKAQTRYSEDESCEVLLLRGMRLSPLGDAARLTLLSGETLTIPLQRHRHGRAEWRHKSAKLMRQVVGVRVRDAPNALPQETIKRFGLQHCFYLGNPTQDEATLRVALVDDTGRLQGVQHAPVHAKHNLEYRSDLGYRVIKG